MLKNIASVDTEHKHSYTYIQKIRRRYFTQLSCAYIYMLCIIIENILLNYHCHSCLCYGELHIFTSILICCFRLFSLIFYRLIIFLTFFAVSVSCVWLHIHRTCRSWSASLVAIFFTREFDLSVYVIARCNLTSVWFASLTIFAEGRRFILELQKYDDVTYEITFELPQVSRGKPHFRKFVLF